MKKRLLAIILALALLMVLLAACQTADSDTGTTDEAPTSEGTTSESTDEATEGEDANLRFMWWGGDTRHAQTIEALELYMANNPGTRIEFEYTGWSGYFDKLLTQIAGNNAPDIVQLSYTSVSEYVYRDQLLSLSDAIDDGTFRVENLNEDLLGVYNYDGNLYAVPSGINAQLLYYNIDMFDELGVDYPTSGMTLDEYYDLGRTVNDAARAAGNEDFYGLNAFTADYAGFDVAFQRMILDFGGNMWTQDSSAAAFNSDAGLQTLAYSNIPFEEGFAPPLELTKSNPDGISDFAIGRTSMVIANATVAAVYEDGAEFEVGMALAPFGNNYNVTWYQASQVFTIMNQTEYPTEAIKVLDFMINDLEAGAILGFERGISLNEEVRSSFVDEMTDFEKLQLELVNSVADNIDEKVMEPYPIGYINIHTEASRILEGYYYGATTAEDALAELETYANDIINSFE